MSDDLSDVGDGGFHVGGDGDGGAPARKWGRPGPGCGIFEFVFFSTGSRLTITEEVLKFAEELEMHERNAEKISCGLIDLKYKLSFVDFHFFK
jgi:hypothetical protein